MPVKLAQKYCLIYALLSNFYEVSTQVQLHRRSKDFVGKFHYLLPQLRNIVQVHYMLISKKAIKKQVCGVLKSFESFRARNSRGQILKRTRFCSKKKKKVKKKLRMASVFFFLHNSRFCRVKQMMFIMQEQIVKRRLSTAPPNISRFCLSLIRLMTTKNKQVTAVCGRDKFTFEDRRKLTVLGSSCLSMKRAASLFYLCSCMYCTMQCADSLHAYRESKNQVVHEICKRLN